MVRVGLLCLVGLGGALALWNHRGIGRTPGRDAIRGESGQTHFKTIQWDLARDRSLKAVGWRHAGDGSICAWVNVKRLDVVLPDGSGGRFNNCHVMAGRSGDVIDGLQIRLLDSRTLQDAVVATHELMDRFGEPREGRGLEAWADGVRQTPRSGWKDVCPYTRNEVRDSRFTSYLIDFDDTAEGDSTCAWSLTFVVSFR